MKFKLLAFVLLLITVQSVFALEKQPAETYHARRVDLAQKLKGGAAILFAASQPLVDFMPYRQDEDFYYLTGWNEPGAALLILAEAPANPQAVQPPLTAQARHYREILFLPTRNLR